MLYFTDSLFSVFSSHFLRRRKTDIPVKPISTIEPCYTGTDFFKVPLKQTGIKNQNLHHFSCQVADNERRNSIVRKYIPKSKTLALSTDHSTILPPDLVTDKRRRSTRYFGHTPFLTDFVVKSIMIVISRFVILKLKGS